MHAGIAPHGVEAVEREAAEAVEPEDARQQLRRGLRQLPPAHPARNRLMWLHTKQTPISAGSVEPCHMSYAQAKEHYPPSMQQSPGRHLTMPLLVQRAVFDSLLVSVTTGRAHRRP